MSGVSTNQSKQDKNLLVKHTAPKASDLYKVSEHSSPDLNFVRNSLMLSRSAKWHWPFQPSFMACMQLWSSLF